MKLLVKRKFLFFLFFAFLCSLIVGGRGNTNDTYTYYSIFKNIDSYDLTSYYNFYLLSGVELGWGLYSKVISIFSDSSLVLFSIFSFLTFSFIYKASHIIRLNYAYVMAFYIPSGFFLMQQFMQIRQGLAVPAVVLASLLYLSNKKKWSIVFFIIAILFHQITFSYILIFLCYLLLDRKYPLSYSRLRFYSVLFGILFFVFILARTVMLPLASSFFDRLVSYSNSDYAEEVGFFSLANIKFYLEFVLILCLTNKKILLNKFYVFMVFIFTVGLTLRIAFFDFGILSGRLSNVFLFIEIFLIPYLLSQRLKKAPFYLFLTLYFIIIFYVTWVYQAGLFLQDYYFIPLE
ncbi:MULTISPECIES: EpsG family protein [Acinetobacter]|uniref:EpsG family protein n=1 Tax=Acinetobacter higginsii TaxID=70347 RepID=N9RUL2_9GAMM|nr:MULTISPECIES: EpsG family protein [Acinetobacter]ENX61609.1 hypothetical protein F902_00646 [Acinetobacter higginsii]